MVATRSVGLAFFLKSFCSMAFDKPVSLLTAVTAAKRGLSQVEGLLLGTGIQVLPAHVFEWLILKVCSLNICFSEAGLDGSLLNSSSEEAEGSLGGAGWSRGS